MTKLLFTPGPINVPTYFRDRDFPKMVLENERLLKKAVGCKRGKAILYSMSGTGALDASVTNLISDEDRVLVVVSGGFGKRWYDICKFYNKNVVAFFVPFGQDIDLKLLENTMSINDINVVLCQHHETNSGQLHDIKSVGKLAKMFGALFIVDAISSFLTDEFYMDRWNVDACLISTQKGMRLDPGIAFLIVNERAIAHSKAVKKLNFYSNIETYLSEYCLGRGHTPFTPPVNLVYDINESLNNTHVKGKVNAQKMLVDWFRKDIKGLPLRMLPETPSNFLTALLITDPKYSAIDLYNHLRKAGMFISKVGKAHDPFILDAEKRFFLVSHIGCNWKEHKKLIGEMRLFFDKGNKN